MLLIETLLRLSSPRLILILALGFPAHSAGLCLRESAGKTPSLDPHTQGSFGAAEGLGPFRTEAAFTGAWVNEPQFVLLRTSLHVAMSRERGLEVPALGAYYHGAKADAESRSPIGKEQRLPGRWVRELNGWLPFVASLFDERRPSDVSGLVTSLVVDSIERMLHGWALSDVREDPIAECFVRSRPLRIHGDSPAAVVAETLGGRIEDTGLDASPLRVEPVATSWAIMAVRQASLLRSNEHRQSKGDTPDASR